MGTTIRWHPYRKRSADRHDQLQAVHAARGRPKLDEISRHGSSNKENRPLGGLSLAVNHITSHDQLLASQLRAKHFERRFRNERKNNDRAHQNTHELTKELKDCRAELWLVQSKIDGEKIILHDGLQWTGEQLKKSDEKLAAAQDRILSLSRTKKNLASQVSRIADRIDTARARDKTVSLKEDGIFSLRTRDMTRGLIGQGVPVSGITNVISVVAESLGVKIKGSVSSRSAGRMTLEGGVAAKMQLAYDVNHSTSVSLSGDGTTHKHINFEARSVAVQGPVYDPGVSVTKQGNSKSDPVMRFAGISAAPNHTSQEQLNGWNKFIHEIHDLWNSSPAGVKEPADFRNFYLRALGMGTDHANDQKKLKSLFQEMKRQYDREVRGERALLMASPTELLILICQLHAEKIVLVGGDEKWNALPVDEQCRHDSELHRELCLRYGEKAFTELTPEQQQEADFFVWAGCCMHKDLNSHKGGNACLVTFWEKNNLTGPIILMNKDNTAASALGTSAAKDRAEIVSSAGGVKLTSLMGALLNHKDDKKGQQDLTAIFMESHLGFIVRFPDTSNTRYQSHSEAAAEVIVHLPLYIQFLDHIRIKKEARTFTNLEQNILRGLQDVPTVTELCVLAAYGQAVTHPYMREVRGANRKHTNILDLGPLHVKVVSHCTKLIATPELLFGPEANYREGAMDEKLWDRPEAIYAIQAMANGLPHLRCAMISFLEGALETWRRFSAEFDNGGDIALASAEQRQRAWMPTTNDHNEGALGAFRVAKRRAPNMTLETHNARKMSKQNHTDTFISAKLSHPEDQSFLRKSARTLGSAGNEKLRRQMQAESDKQQIQAKLEKDRIQQQKKDEYAAKVASVSLSFSENDLRQTPPTVPQIELQLEWHRQHKDLGKYVPMKKDMVKLLKAAKLNYLIEAVKRYNAL